MASTSSSTDWTDYLPGKNVNSLKEFNNELYSKYNKDRTVFTEAFMTECPKSKSFVKEYRCAADRIMKNFPDCAAFVNVNSHYARDFNKAYNIRKVPIFLAFQE